MNSTPKQYANQYRATLKKLRRRRKRPLALDLAKTSFLTRLLAMPKIKTRNLTRSPKFTPTPEPLEDDFLDLMADPVRESLATPGVTPTQVLLDRVVDQLENGLDEERLLESRDKRARALVKTLEAPMHKNRYARVIADCVFRCLRGKAQDRKTAEKQLINTIRNWQLDVEDLVPSRVDQLWTVIVYGFSHPAPKSPK